MNRNVSLIARSVLALAIGVCLALGGIACSQNHGGASCCCGADCSKEKCTTAKCKADCSAPCCKKA